MSSPETDAGPAAAEFVVTEAMISDAAKLLAALPPDVAIEDDDLRGALAALVRIFGERAAEDRKFLPFPEGHHVTATEGMIAVTAILRALNLQLFELGMWQNWTGRH